MGFARSNGLSKRWCKVELLNQDGDSWTLDLRHRRSRRDHQVYIRGGWSGFCRENGLKAGDLCTFKLVRNGTKPALKLCSKESRNGSFSGGREGWSRRRCKSSSRRRSTRRASSSPSGQDRFVTLTLTSNRHQRGQLTQREFGDDGCDDTQTITGVNAVKRRSRETVQPPRTAEESSIETDTGTRKRARVHGPIHDPDQLNISKSVLRSCSEDSRNSSEEEGCSEADENNCRRGKSSLRKCSKALRTQRASSSSSRKTRFVTLTLTPHSHKTGLMHLPSHFARSNGIKEPGKVTLLDKNEVERPSHIRLVKKPDGSYLYIRKNCRVFCKANGVKLGESFILELIWEDTTPILKFCSKTKRRPIRRSNEEDDSESAEDEENRHETMAEVNTRKRRTRQATQEQDPDADTETVTHKRSKKHQEHSCTDASASKASTDAMAKAKEIIEDALIAVRESREVLAKKEQNLKASLSEFNGEET